MNINLLIVIASYSAIAASVMKSPILDEENVGDGKPRVEKDVAVVDSTEP